MFFVSFKIKNSATATATPEVLRELTQTTAEITVSMLPTDFRHFPDAHDADESDDDANDAHDANDTDNDNIADEDTDVGEEVIKSNGT